MGPSRLLDEAYDHVGDAQDEDNGDNAQDETARHVLERAGPRVLALEQRVGTGSSPR